MADGKVVIDVILEDGQVAKGVANVDKRLGGLTGAGKRAAAGIGQIAGALGLVAVASKAIDMVTQALDGAISRYDTLNNFPRVLQLLGFDADSSEKAIQRLSDGIDGLPTTLDDVASTTQRIAGMTGDLDGAVETTLALNNAFLASGSSSADAQRGLEQYVQMLSKGEVDLQSFRSLQETMPIALNKVAEAFGMTGASAQNDLYDALKEGDVTFDQFNSKLIELSNATGGFSDMARESTGGIATSWQNMQTAIVKGVADVIGAIDEALGGVGSISGIIDTVKSGIQTFFSWLVGIVPVVIGNLMSVIEMIRGWLPPVSEVRDGFINAFQMIYDIATPIVQSIVDFIMSVWGGLVSWWQQNGEMISQAARNLSSVLLAIFNFLWPFLRSLVVSTWNAIKGVIQGAIGVITGIIQAFSALFTGNWSALWSAIKQIVSNGVKLVWNLVNLWFVGRILKLGKSIATGLRGIVSNLWNLVRSIFTNGVNSARNVVNSGFNFIRNIVSNVTNSIRSVISSGWNSARSIISNVTNSIRSTVSNIFRSLSSIVTGSMSRVTSAVRSGITGALSAVTGMAGRFLQAGRNIVTSIANGIRGAIGSVTSAISDVTSKIRNFLPFSPAKEGALRDIMDVQIGESIAEAIGKGEGTAVNAMKDLTDKLDAEIQPNVRLNRLRGAGTPLGNILPSSGLVTTNAIEKTSGQGAIRNDSEVKALLRQIANKTGDVFMGTTKVGEIMDGEQAKRTGYYGRRVAY